MKERETTDTQMWISLVVGGVALFVIGVLVSPHLGTIVRGIGSVCGGGDG